jgi:hypothetical protein
MLRKSIPLLAAAMALVIAGCGGHSHVGGSDTAAGNSTGETQTDASVGTHVRTSQQSRRVPLVKQHASKGEETLSAAEGPARPRSPRALPASSYHVTLTARGATPARSTSDAALVTLIPAKRQVCWRFGRLPVVTVRTRAFGAVRMILRPVTASIHAGGKGANGPVVVPLHGRYAPRGCTVAAPVVLNSILSAPRFYYVSLGDATSPTGTLRAQL